MRDFLGMLQSSHTQNQHKIYYYTGGLLSFTSWPPSVGIRTHGGSSPGPGRWPKVYGFVRKRRSTCLNCNIFDVDNPLCW